MKETLHVYEVGLRDGLQNETAFIDTQNKIAWLQGLVDAGLQTVELTSFVSPKAVPQMADAPHLVTAAQDHEALVPYALIINEKGYRRAVEAGASAIALVVVLTETLSQKNSRMSVEAGLTQALRLLQSATDDGLTTRVYLAPAWIDPYEGPVSEDHVRDVAARVAKTGAAQLALADTIGQAHPEQVETLFRRIAEDLGGPARLAAHLHDTQGLGLANAYGAMKAGVRTIDASFGGLGGCPFAPGSAGNLATEDLVLMADKMGFETGIDLHRLWALIERAEAAFDRPLGGRSRAWYRAHAPRRH